MEAKRSRGLGLSFKLVSASSIIMVGVAIVLTLQASGQLRASRTRSAASKGEAIALSLASAAEMRVDRDSTSIQGDIDANKIIEGVKYIYITDADGNVTVHTFTPAFPDGLQKLNPLVLGEILPENTRTKTHEIDYRKNGIGVHAIDVAAPAAGGALGTVHVGMDMDVIDRDVAELTTTMALRALVVALVGITFMFLLSTFVVVRPVRELTRATTRIIAEGDLTQKVSVSSRDEIGALAETFQEMVAKLREIPVNLATTTERLSESVNELAATATQGDALVARQASALRETQVTVQEIKQTSLLAAQKAESVLKVAERADDVSKSGEQAIEQSRQGLEEIGAEVSQIAQQIAAVAERTRQVGLITDTVKSLADQSNMLALNAAIEAVRSGEHGKGFAVVAREIRSLADQSIQATAKVREILDDIGSASRNAVTITDRGLQRIEGGLSQMRASGDNLRELSDIVKENSSAVRQIAAAVSQQNAGVAQIFVTVTELNGMMNETVKGLEATTKSAKTLKDVTKNVSNVVSSFRV